AGAAPGYHYGVGRVDRLQAIDARFRQPRPCREHERVHVADLPTDLVGRALLRARRKMSRRLAELARGISSRRFLPPSNRGALRKARVELLADLHRLLAGKAVARGEVGDRLEVAVEPARQAALEHPHRGG